MIKYFIIISFLLFVATASVCNPEFLAKNSFLESFVTHEILGILAVIMTVTFASVANIHFYITRIVGKTYGADLNKGQRKADAPRSELNTNAWLLFWCFSIACGLLITKGSPIGEIVEVRSLLNGMAIGTLLINIIVFHDIYETLFTLASSDNAAKSEISSNE